MDKQSFSGKTVLVMGLGRFGGGADSAGFAAATAERVIVTDKASPGSLAGAAGSLESIKNIELHLGGHIEKDFLDADIIIASPAVEPENVFLKIAADAGKTITSQIEIFSQLCPVPIVGITGSNGKSTTAALTAHLLKNAKNQNRRVFLSGNIGKMPLLEIVEQIKPDDIVVLELSSFQLEQLTRIKKSPHISCVTNLSPNHLDRHKTMAGYIEAKENIFRFQGSNDFAILNAKDLQCLKWFAKYSGSRKCVLFDTAKLNEELVNGFKLPGESNMQNLVAAITICRCLGIEDEQLAGAVAAFEPLPHRLELVAEKNLVRWYNDSIATTPESTIAALEAFDSPKILIAGGYDKGLDFGKLAHLITEKAKAVVLIGQTAESIAREIKKIAAKNKFKILMAGSLETAVRNAEGLSEKGDIVLLSPACASYDMFENFEQRGEEFANLVRAL